MSANLQDAGYILLPHIILQDPGYIFLCKPEARILVFLFHDIPPAANTSTARKPHCRVSQEMQNYMYPAHRTWAVYS